MAGLRARTAEHEASPPPAPSRRRDRAGSGRAVARPGAGPSPPDADDDGGRHRRALWARFLAASFVIVVSMAAATSISLLVYLTDIAEGLCDNDELASLRDQLDEVDGGDPQTILILGSDKRLDTEGDPGARTRRSCCASTPTRTRSRCSRSRATCKVNIPGLRRRQVQRGLHCGGPTTDARGRSSGSPGSTINHVVNINFTGFADAVNAIDCVYIDVDRRYYIPPESEHRRDRHRGRLPAALRLKALQYVRFRHDDTDLVRSARQQDFLREARQKLTAGQADPRPPSCSTSSPSTRPPTSATR